MKIRRNLFFAFSILILAGAMIYGVAAATSFSGARSGTSYSQYQYRPSFQTYYGAEAQTYWPILGDRQTCEARQDLLLNVAPAGCQPVVVRSDLLAEQNVPVFCQIDALKINPLIDISQIRSISFKGEYPEEVVGAGFHPARAAFRTHDKLLGKPLINNVGYVVLVLRQQPDESKLPDMINVTLEAQLDYVSGNAYGVGKAEFVLAPVRDEEWEFEKYRQSFWNGRYYVRLERVDADFADVSIYEGERKINTVRVEKGKTSSRFFVPGMYCRAGLEVAYDGFVIAEDKATLEVSSDAGVDVFEVYKGARFMDGRCNVQDIQINGNAGKVIGSCSGKKFELSLFSYDNSSYSILNDAGKIVEPELKNGEYRVEFKKLDDSSRNGIYILKTNNVLVKLPQQGGEEKTVVDANGNVSNVGSSDVEWSRNLWNALKNYKDEQKKDANYRIGEQRNRAISSEANNYYRAAIENYRRVAEDYPSEKIADVGDGAYYGERALRNAIRLAETAGANKDKMELINEYLSLYGDEQYAPGFEEQLNELSYIDSSESTEVIEFDDRTRTIRLVRLEKPKQEAKAEILVEGKRISVSKDERVVLNESGREFGEIKIDELRKDRIEVRTFCGGRADVNFTKSRRYSLVLNKEVALCDLDVELVNVELGESAKIRVLPFAEGTETTTNVTISVGIEKRAVELSTDKALEKIENLNKTIQKWEGISSNLGNVVTGLKGACFATSTLLTFKNFLTGLSGETIARQQVMQTWREKCAELAEYRSLEECYFAKSSEIDSDVARTTQAINVVNTKIQEIQSRHRTSSGIFWQSVDSDAVRRELAVEARKQYGNTVIDVSQLGWRDSNGNVLSQATLNEVISDENVNSGAVSTEDVKLIMTYAELEKQQGLSESYREGFSERLQQVAERVNENKLIYDDLKNAENYAQRNLPTPVPLDLENERTRYLSVKPISNEFKNTNGASPKVTHLTTVRVKPGVSSGDTGDGFEGGVYVLGLDGGGAKDNVYTVKDVWLEEKTTQGYRYTKLAAEKVPQFADVNKVGAIQSADGASYTNEIVEKDRVVRYYETEPYRGMPAIVPFDVRNGWYSATRQQLPVFGGIGAFDSSGRVTSFWLCNVGRNGRVEFETGFGDDLCQQVNLNTGQPLGVFPGLSEREARTLIDRGVRAIEDAANQYGGKNVRILGQPFSVGAPSTGQPGTQCADFMSPKECLLLFNVCDPVICPSSRCDFGGTYPVANVAQTGIVGSVMLCLPNIREGIAIPVCLTGIQAGIDGYVSILKNYRDCLQEHVETGQMVGLCDQIYSIYLCDFFWNQVAPFVNVLVPKLIEVAYGQGVRGGGEYLTVQAAWQNMENSMNYFTQSYAANSLQAFQTRTQGQYGGNPFTTSGAIAEIGGQFCESFVSAKAPAAFKSFIEPDSPPQFHAWFDSARYSDATVPATARYKVFYHIFAGKDSGVYYDVYLKNPPESYYATAPTVVIASGYIPKGEYASASKDLTAPEGYQELCVRVNAQEECGFKQVSTSFAVNYLRDTYIKEEATNANIQTERECVGGTPSAYNLINPNVQAGVEDTIAPQIYNRGLIRICSTENPGKGTNEERFVDVGYCDDPKVRCWIDKSSVDDAITKNNIGVLNETLEELEGRIFELLSENGTLLTQDEAVAELNSIEEETAALSKNVELPQANELLNRINSLEQKLFYNNHKAWLLFIEGRVNDIVAVELLGKEDSKNDNASSAVGANKFTDDEKYYFTLGAEIDTSSGSYRNLVVDGNYPSEYYIQEGVNGEILVYYISPIDINQPYWIGRVEGGKISITNIHANNFISDSEIFLLNGAIVEGFLGDVNSDNLNNRNNLGGVSDGNCKLVSAQWLDGTTGENLANEAKVFESAPLGLMVVGEGNCDKKEISYSIYEKDAFQSLSRYTTTSSFFDNESTGIWIAVWEDDNFLPGIEGNPEYGFIASLIEDEGESVESGLIEVTKNAGEIIENNGGENTEQVFFQNYSLREEVRTEWGGFNSRNIERVYFGEEPLAIYIYFQGIYAIGAYNDSLVGAITISGQRLNIPDNLIEEARANAPITDEKTIEHLRFLHNKFYDELRAGTVQCAPEEISDCVL